MKYKDEGWLREQYESKTQAEIADECGVTRGTIGYWMDKFGIETDSRGCSQVEGKHKDETWLREQYVEELRSLSDLANQASVAETTIKYQLDKYDIELRSQSEAAEIRAERDPHTWGTENIRDYNWWEEAGEEEREAFREQLSEARQGEDNPMYNRTGADHPRWREDKPAHRFYQSEKWKETREEVLERDDHECQACGTDDDLHVHHIQPISAGGPRFDTNNLVTLCNHCHKEWEGLYLRPDTR